MCDFSFIQYKNKKKVYTCSRAILGCSISVKNLTLLHVTKKIILTFNNIRITINSRLAGKTMCNDIF